MNDYSMSDDLFRQRALEEGGCVITAVGSGLATAMNFDGGSISLNEEKRCFVQGKNIANRQDTEHTPAEPHEVAAPSKVKMNTSEMVSAFPDPREFMRIRRSHPSVIEAIDVIAEGFTVLFDAIKRQDESRDKSVLFIMVGAGYREFEEILTLGLNGYGAGATKLLRALYERTVTILYLMKHPGKVQQFIDFTAVHWHKLLIEADTNGVGDQLPQERRDEIEHGFKEVEKDFTETVCAPCKKTRLQGSWTKKPVPTQAREISKELGDYCFRGYLMPTFFLHTTFWGIGQQIREHADGKFVLQTRENEFHHATGTVIIACNLMKHLAEGMNEYYGLEAVEACTKISNAVDGVGEELLSEAGDVAAQG